MIKTTIRIFAVFVIFCFKTTFAQTMPPVANTQTVGDSAEVPKFDGSERWEYRTSPRRTNDCNPSRPFRFTISVNSVDPDGITLMRGTTKIKHNAGMAELQEVNGISNIQDTFNFPVIPGKKWQQRMLGKYSDNSELRTDLTCEHKTPEKIKVPAGLFDTYPIVCKGRWTHITSGNAGEANYLYWYAPTVKNIVKREVLTYSNGNVCADTETVLTNLGAAATVIVPQKTNFAPVEDETKLPYVRNSGRAGYKDYLTKTIPRAFAIAPNGAWAWNLGVDAISNAIDACNRNGKDLCKLYSVDDFVVWVAE